MSISNLNMKKKMKVELILFCIGFLVISVKLAYVQFVKGGEYSSKAIEQLNNSRRIPANRGIIYDCNGEILANSSTVYTVNVNPAKISMENKEKVARSLSVVNIAKKQPKELTDALRVWMENNNISTRNKH